MSQITKAIVLVVAVQHVLFLMLEMFLWQTEIGLKVFHMTKEVARTTSKLALNQGLYNGFLAAGLVWALITGSREAAGFFLVCVSIAGIVGGLTVNRTIFFVQAVPAMLGILSFWYH